MKWNCIWGQGSLLCHSIKFISFFILFNNVWIKELFKRFARHTLLSFSSDIWQLSWTFKILQFCIHYCTCFTSCYIQRFCLCCHAAKQAEQDAWQMPFATKRPRKWANTLSPYARCGHIESLETITSATAPLSHPNSCWPWPHAPWGG